MRYDCPNDSEGNPLIVEAFLEHKNKTKRDNIERAKITGEESEQSDEELELELDTKLPASQGSHSVECLSSDDKTTSVQATQHSATEVAALPHNRKLLQRPTLQTAAFCRGVFQKYIFLGLYRDRKRDVLMHLSGKYPSVAL